jgi:hypothetical protein
MNNFVIKRKNIKNTNHDKVNSNFVIYHDTNNLIDHAFKYKTEIMYIVFTNHDSTLIV